MCYFMYIRKKWQFNDDYLFNNVAHMVVCHKPTGETKYALSDNIVSKMAADVRNAWISS